MFALIKSDFPGEYHIAEIVRDGKRYAWVRYSGLGEIRETRRKTAWRFDTYEEADAMRIKLEEAA